MSHRPQRIVIATIGSLGDLHPCLALGLELRRRGHSVALATTEFYRERVVALSLDFYAMRPDWKPDDHELIKRCEDMMRGPEVLFREMVLPELRGTYDDLVHAASEADLLIAGELVFAAPLVAEKLGLPWVSSLLSPCSFFSAHDPSVLVNVPALVRLREAGWLVNRLLLDFGRFATRHWWNPVRRFRRELGLSVQADPLFRDKFSPDLVLALFSGELAEPQPDWPAQTVQPGFVYYDRLVPAAEPSPELAAFLASGEAPIVFTLGSAAVSNPGTFYEESAKAAHRLGRRALLLIGANPPPVEISPEILALSYAPYSQVFPYAAAVVHQGGSGTTGQALRAGVPMLIVPYGWDQPDNGARVERLGAGLTLSRDKYTAETAADALSRILSSASFADTARRIGKQLDAEDGLTVACDAIERVLGAKSE